MSESGNSRNFTVSLIRQMDSLLLQINSLLVRENSLFSPSREFGLKTQRWCGVFDAKKRSNRPEIEEIPCFFTV